MSCFVNSRGHIILKQMVKGTERSLWGREGRWGDWWWEMNRFVLSWGGGDCMGEIRDGVWEGEAHCGWCVGGGGGGIVSVVKGGRMCG